MQMTQPGEICLMMEDSEGVLYRLAEPRASKPDIESTAAEHARQSFSYQWGAAGWVEFHMLMFDLSALTTLRKGALDSLRIFSSTDRQDLNNVRKQLLILQ
jgi:hypothetical protein